MSKVLVTGGAGFIGSHLCEALIGQGHEVTCLDDFSTGKKHNIAHLDSLRVVEGDVNESQTWQKLANDHFAAVFHYAATVGVRRTEEYPSAVLADVEGIRQVAALAQAGRADKIIYASSSEVYGEPAQLPEIEEIGMSAWSPYTAIKMYGEHVFRSLWQEHKVPAVSLRFFNVYGPRQLGNGYGFVVATFIRQILRGEAPTVFGNGRQTRDFVYQTDNVKAALAAWQRPEANGQVINVGSGRETSISDLALTVLLAAGKGRNIQPVHLPARSHEINRRRASVSKMRKILGVTCSTSLEMGLTETVTWAKREALASRQLTGDDLPKELPVPAPAAPV